MTELTEHRRPKILIVDDDPEAALLFRTWFKDDGPYEILDAPDGERGLRVAQEQAPDLILLDLQMPGLDGIQLSTRLKADAATRSIPLIMISACRDTETKVDGFAAGVNDYVTKPFEFAEVAARIEAMLRVRNQLVRLESDLAEEVASNAELEELLGLDEKTGLANFRAFQRKLREHWQLADRYSNKLSLVLLDIDHFKQVNDQYGHLFGDLVLSELAGVLTGALRETDFLARYGGEEFLVILPQTHFSGCLPVAERVWRSVADAEFTDGKTTASLTISVGVAFYPNKNIADVEQLLAAADRALYQAKDEGRNRICLFQHLSYVYRPQPTSEP